MLRGCLAIAYWRLGVRLFGDVGGPEKAAEQPTEAFEPIVDPRAAVASPLIAFFPPDSAEARALVDQVLLPPLSSQ